MKERLTRIVQSCYHRVEITITLEDDDGGSIRFRSDDGDGSWDQMELSAKGISKCGMTHFAALCEKIYGTKLVATVNTMI